MKLVQKEVILTQLNEKHELVLVLPVIAVLIVKVVSLIHLLLS